MRTLFDPGAMSDNCIQLDSGAVSKRGEISDQYAWNLLREGSRSPNFASIDFSKIFAVCMMLCWSSCVCLHTDLHISMAVRSRYLKR